MKRRLIRGNADHASARNKDGMALVLTLLIVAIITAMVVEFAYGVYTNTTSLYNWQTSQQLSLAARSAVKLAAKVIAEKALDNKNTQGSFEMAQKVPFGDLDATITLRIEDENTKFNLNSLIQPNGTLDTDRYAQFVKLLQLLKLPTSIADRVADWIDPDSTPRLPDSEAGAKNAYLDSVDELLRIPGIDKKTYGRLSRYVTIYGNASAQSGYSQAVININDAGILVLSSLPGVDESMAEKAREHRETTPFVEAQNFCDLLGIGEGCEKIRLLTTTNSHVFHVIATAESGGITRKIDSVLQVMGINNATVLYWKET